VSFNLELRWNDEYEYLHNARALLKGGADYLGFRTPLLSLSYLPLALAVRDDFFSLMRAAALQAVVVSILGLATFYVALRRSIAAPLALLAALLLTLNPLVLHYAQLITIDMPSLLAMAVVLGALSTIEKKVERKDKWIMAAGLAAANLSRRNLFF